jgi:PAS domain S-box-containing protein
MSARYRAAVDAAAIFSETDKSGIITYVNEQFCDISGVALDALYINTLLYIQYYGMEEYL